MKVTFLIISFHVFVSAAFWKYGTETKAETSKTKTELPPEDRLLKAAIYDNSQFAIYERGGEAMVGGEVHSIAGYGYLNALMETEIVDTVNWTDYIVIGQNGVTRFRIGNRSCVCVPAQSEKK